MFLQSFALLAKVPMITVLLKNTSVSFCYVRNYMQKSSIWAEISKDCMNKQSATVMNGRQNWQKN